MDDINVSDNKETKISSKAYNESYFIALDKILRVDTRETTFQNMSYILL